LVIQDDIANGRRAMDNISSAEGTHLLRPSNTSLSQLDRSFKTLASNALIYR